MSGRLMGQVFGLKLSRTERDVLQAVCDHSDDTGRGARPGIRLLSWKCDLSERQIQRILGRLKAKGLLVPVAHAAGGRGRATSYLINLAGAERKPAYQFRSTKGDTQTSPLAEGKGDTSGEERVTSELGKGDILSEKSDILASPQPSFEPPPKRTAKFMSRAPTRSQPTEIPPDFCPSPESIAWAREHCPQLNPEPQTRRFVLFYGATGRRCVDWDARWRLWLIDSAERHGKGGGQRFLSSAERSEERLRQRDYKADGEAVAARLAARRASGRSRFDPDDF